MFAHIFGLPKINGSITVKLDGNPILSESITACAFFMASRDCGRRGGAFGGKNDSFLKTNTRLFMFKVVDLLRDTIGMKRSTRIALRKALKGPSPQNGSWRWIGIPALILGLLLSLLFFAMTLSTVPTGPTDPILSSIIGFCFGAFFGGVCGWATRMLYGFFNDC